MINPRHSVRNIRRVNMWTLGERSGSKSRLSSRIVVNLSEHEGKPKIHFRHFECSKKQGGGWFPTERGVALNLEEWETFLDNFAEIDFEIRQLKTENDKATSIPSTDVKRNLCSTFGGVYE